MGSDANQQVFVSPGQAAATRRVAMRAEWQKSAISIVRISRPDIEVGANGDSAIELSADGYKQVVDLSALEPALSRPEARPREIISAHIDALLREFDEERLKVLGFTPVAGRIVPYLVNGTDLTTMAASIKAESLPAVPVVGGLSWTPVVEVKVDESETVIVPISAAVMSVWKVDAAKVQQTALANLRTTLKAEIIETQKVGSVGRAGSLRPSANPAVVVLPEFLRLVRETWKTADELLLFVPGRRDVRFIERGQTRLAGLLIPGWLARGNAGDCLSSSILVVGENGLSPMPPLTPTTKPAATSAPATTRIYIVH